MALEFVSQWVALSKVRDKGKALRKGPWAKFVEDWQQMKEFSEGSDEK